MGTYFYITVSTDSTIPLCAQAYLWEIALGVADQQTRLAASTIANHHKLFGVGGRLGNIGRLRHVPAGEACVGAGSAVTNSDAVGAGSVMTRGH